jgi:inosose dehydratase
VSRVEVRVGCQANAWQRELKVQERLPDVLRAIAGAGYEGVELPAWSIPSLEDPAPVRELLAAAGLAPIAIHVGGVFHEDAPFREKALPLARRAAACAAALGAEGIVVSAAAKRAPLTTVPFDPKDANAAHTRPPAHERKDAAELALQRENLSAVARLDHDLGLKTYYHNHFTEFAHDDEELRSILDVEPALLSLCFDIGNAARALQGDALAAAMERHWGRIGYLHFKDPKGDTLAESLGEGDVDFQPVSDIVRRRGFRGWATAEIEPAAGMVVHRSVAEDARLSCDFIRRAMGQ